MIKIINTIASETISFNKLSKLLKSQKLHFEINPAGSNPRIAVCTVGRYPFRS